MATTYVSGLLGPMLVTSTGLGMLFVPLSLVALSRVRAEDSGVASSLLNTGQQVGGAIGLAALGTVTWSAVASSVKSQAAHAAAAGQAVPAKGGTPSASILDQALATGISRGFLVAAGIAVLALIVVITMIRVRRGDLTGAPETPEVSPAQPAAVAIAAEPVVLGSAQLAYELGRGGRDEDDGRSPVIVGQVE